MIGKLKFALLFLFIALNSNAVESVSSSYIGKFYEEYPKLKKFTFKEPLSGIFFGIGVSPISLLNNRIYFGGNFFQVHWIKNRWDIEILSASVGFSVGSDMVGVNKNSTASRHFTIRTFPKFRLFKNMSLGPVFGIEFISFPEINAQQLIGVEATNVEPFSNQGFIWGFGASQLIELSNGMKLKINEIAFRQTYSVTESAVGTIFVFSDNEIQSDPERALIAPGWVFLIEASVLF